MRILAVTRHGCKEEVTLHTVSPWSAVMGLQVDLIVIDPGALDTLSETERKDMAEWVEFLRLKLVPGANLKVIGAAE